MSAIWMMAAADLGKAFQEHSRRTNSWAGASWFLSFVLFAIVFFVVLYYWDRIRTSIRGEPSGDRTLFDELCKSHRLTDSERDMLTKAVENASVTLPAYVFVDRSILLEYAKQKGAPKRTCTALIRKLFGDD